jgi:4-hydroxybenzoate polyprenyltransferase
VGIFLIFTYSAKLKKTQIGFLPPALAAFLIPLGAFAVYDPAQTFCRASIVIGLAGFFFELVPYWSQTLPDVEGDRNRGLKTISVCHGERTAAVFIFLSFAVCLVFLLYLYKIALLSTPYLLFTTIVGGLLALFLVWFIFRPDARNALISYFSSLFFIAAISLIIIAEMALPTLTDLWNQFRMSQ